MSSERATLICNLIPDLLRHVVPDGLICARTGVCAEIRPGTRRGQLTDTLLKRSEMIFSVSIEMQSSSLNIP